jgi:NAD(P)-dependent dehydrogenase (short-subunit alcohol dehydrogenase family)
MDARVAIISGAGRGIGQAACLKLASAGWAICAADINAKAAQATVDNIQQSGGGMAIAATADIANEAAVQAMVARTIETFGRIDALVNAAGGYGQAFRATHETPLDEWQMVLASNLTGYFLCAKHVLPPMMAQQRGCIINFASNAGRSVSPLLGASYTTAKTGVIGLTRHLAHEYGRYGIRVNTLAPGPVDGERVSELIGTDQSDTQDSKARLAEQIPLGRLAHTDDIVDVLSFLVSDESRYMNGAILDVNGGYVLA